MFYWETVHPGFNVAIVSKRTCIGAWSFELWTVRFIQRSLFGSYFIYRSLFLLGVGSSVFWNLTYSSEFLVTRQKLLLFGFLEIPVLFWRSLASSFVVPLPQVEEFEYLRVFITSYRRVEKETSGRWISCVFLPSCVHSN